MAKYTLGAMSSSPVRLPTMDKMTTEENRMPPLRPKSTSPACAAKVSSLVTWDTGTRYMKTALVVM